MLLYGCSGQEQAERERLREQNAKGEYIYRFEGESVVGEIPEPTLRVREPYPWETLEN